MELETAGSPSRRLGPRALPLVGALAAGVSGGVVIILARQQLGLQRLLPVASLWTLWGFMAASITFSFQQFVIYDPADGLVRTHLFRRSNALSLGALSLVLLIASFALRQRIFGSSDASWPLLVAVLPFGSALVGTVRGLVALRRPARLGLLIPADNTVRFLLVIMCAVADADPIWYGCAIVAGFLAVVPFAQADGETGSHRSTKIAARKGAGGSTAAAGLMSHALVTGSPLLLAVVGASPTVVSTVFLLLTAIRVPYLAVQGLVPTVALALQRRSAAPDDQHAALSGALARFAFSATALAVIVAGLGAWFGPWVVDIVFDVDVSGLAAAGAAGSGLLAVSGVMTTVVLMTVARPGLVLGAWAVPLSISTLCFLAIPIRTVGATITALTVAEVSVLALLVCVGFTRHVRLPRV